MKLSIPTMFRNKTKLFTFFTAVHCRDGSLQNLRENEVKL